MLNNCVVIVLVFLCKPIDLNKISKTTQTTVTWNSRERHILYKPLAGGLVTSYVCVVRERVSFLSQLL